MLPWVMLRLELPPALEQGSPQQACGWVCGAPRRRVFKAPLFGNHVVLGSGWRSVFLPLANSQQKDPNGPHCLKSPAIFPRKLLERLASSNSENSPLP